MKKFKKVVQVESFQEDKLIDKEKAENWSLVLVAIPFIGTIIILIYFLSRKKEVYYKEIK